jgi:uncharacterized protein YcbK (DUF882 family)
MFTDKEGHVTQNFKYSELNHSGYALRHGLTNVAQGIAKQNQEWLAIVLEIIRYHFNVPMQITSGYRTEQVNKAVGGSPTSAHVQGSAADVSFADVAKNKLAQRQRAIEIAKYLDSIGLLYDQIIWYPSWIHIGMRFRGTPRRQLFASK